MERRTSGFSYRVYSNAASLLPEDHDLLENARLAAANAYAPYSGFRVGAAARLIGQPNIITGTNQENASYPVGICAERVLLSAVNAIHPGGAIHTIAISAQTDAVSLQEPIFPCGICRQSLLEQEARQQHPIRLVLGSAEGEIFIIEQSADLIPFGFTGKNLQ